MTDYRILIWAIFLLQLCSFIFVDHSLIVLNDQLSSLRETWVVQLQNQLLLTKSLPYLIKYFLHTMMLGAASAMTWYAILLFYLLYLVQTNILDNRDVLYNSYGLYSNIFFFLNVGFCWQCWGYKRWTEWSWQGC